MREFLRGHLRFDKRTFVLGFCTEEGERIGSTPKRTCCEAAGVRPLRRSHPLPRGWASGVEPKHPREPFNGTIPRLRELLDRVAGQEFLISKRNCATRANRDTKT